MLAHHLKVIDETIAQVTSHLNRLQGALTASENVQVNDDLMMHEILHQSAIPLKNISELNKTKPTHTLVHSTLDAMTSQSVHDVMGYKTATEFSNQAVVGTNQTHYDQLVFARTSDAVENVFDFYYLEQSESGLDQVKVTQHSVGVEMSNFNIINTNIMIMQPVTVVSFVTEVNFQFVQPFLRSNKRPCRGISGVKCKQVVLVSDLEVYNKVNDIVLKFNTRSDVPVINTHMSNVKNDVDALRRLAMDGELLSVVSLNTMFNEDFLKRCQLNAHLGVSAYFPSFVEKELLNDGVAVQQSGYKSADSEFRALCIYSNDIEDTVGSFDDLLHNLRRNPNFIVFDTVESGLRHV